MVAPMHARRGRRAAAEAFRDALARESPGVWKHITQEDQTFSNYRKSANFPPKG
jgi:hypothetical protein